MVVVLHLFKDLQALQVRLAGVWGGHKTSGFTTTPFFPQTLNFTNQIVFIQNFGTKFSSQLWPLQCEFLTRSDNLRFEDETKSTQHDLVLR